MQVTQRNIIRTRSGYTVTAEKYYVYTRDIPIVYTYVWLLTHIIWKGLGANLSAQLRQGRQQHQQHQHQQLLVTVLCLCVGLINSIKRTFMPGPQDPSRIPPDSPLECHLFCMNVLAGVAGI